MPAADGTRLVAEHVFPMLASWRPVLDRLGISRETRIGLAAAAEAGRQPLSAEIVARGIVGETAFYRAFAECLGLRFEDGIEPHRFILEHDDCILLLGSRRQDLFVKQEGRDGRTTFLLAPAVADFAALRRQVAAHPSLLGRLRIVAPSSLRRALYARASGLLLRIARFGLFERFPDLSARIVLNAWQGGVIGASLVILPLLALLRPMDTLLAVHVLALVFFVGCVALRGAACVSAGLAPAEVPSQARDEELPVYSVLVALYKEADVVAQLVKALGQLDWPHSRLDVKLVCEADDAETLAALRADPLPAFMEIVEVPPSQPRTKPKALNYALPAALGEFVVLFDAEDRPHPAQLREAWAKFRRSGPDLACLQAPLHIVNADAGFIASQFAFEYCALFEGLLPFLARHRLPLPLGGTSNHFRRAALLEVGGWDPFNVTEDADLGIRLARFGLRTEIITRATLEDAPEQFSVWLHQRTRWFKGYMQSWLVHMRDPAALLRELGPARFTTMQILYAGLVVSSLVHPLIVLTLLMVAGLPFLDRGLTLLEIVLLTSGAVNIACSYLVFLLLGWRSAGRGGRRLLGRVALGMPVYWLLLSFAAWRALWQLWRRPHHWSKTPHGKPQGHARSAQPIP